MSQLIGCMAESRTCTAVQKALATSHRVTRLRPLRHRPPRRRPLPATGGPPRSLLSGTPHSAERDSWAGAVALGKGGTPRISMKVGAAAHPVFEGPRGDSYGRACPRRTVEDSEPVRSYFR